MRRLSQWKKAERSAKRFCRFGETYLIFAYGSNLSLKQMRKRCPGARAVCAGTLFGYCLEFVGYSWCWHGAVANVRPSPGSKIQGVLYAGSDKELGNLDVYEGAPGVYSRHSRLIATEFGPLVTAEVYIHQEPEVKYTPSRAYLRKIGSGYKRECFNPTPLFAAVREAHEQNAVKGSASAPAFRYRYTFRDYADFGRGSKASRSKATTTLKSGKSKSVNGGKADGSPARSTRSGGQVVTLKPAASKPLVKRETSAVIIPPPNDKVIKAVDKTSDTARHYYRLDSGERYALP